MDQKNANKGRRNFLFALGATGAGVAAVAVTKQAVEAPAPAVDSKPQEGRGYQLTEHVKTYYRTARV
jgi:hypothetical protein